MQDVFKLAKPLFCYEDDLRNLPILEGYDVTSLCVTSFIDTVYYYKELSRCTGFIHKKLSVFLLPVVIDSRFLLYNSNE